MTSHPAPSFCACTALTGLSVIISLAQMRMHVDPQPSVRVDESSVFIMQHLTPKPELSASCTSGFLLIRACSPGRQSMPLMQHTSL